MRKLILLVLSLGYTISYAQESEYKRLSKPVVCSTIDKIMSVLNNEKVDEKPIWVGKADDNKSGFAMFVNNETKTFTLIEVRKDIACVLGSGHDSKSVEIITYNN